VTDDVVEAIAVLQRRCRRQGRNNPYWNERIERALDDLVAHPDRIGNPYHLARNALSNAGHLLDRRQELCQISLAGDLCTLDAICDLASRHAERRVPSRPRSATADDAPVQSAIGLRLQLDRSPLSAADRWLLGKLADGTTSAELAEQLDVPAPRVRVRISHARRRARELLTA